MSKILILGASEAEKFHYARWPKYCETPCNPIENQDLGLSVKLHQGLGLDLVNISMKLFGGAG